MKKRIAVCLGIFLLIGYGAFAQDTGFKTFRFDAGAGVAFSLPTQALNDEYQTETNFAMGLLTFRVNIHAGLRLALSEHLSLGVDAGVQYMSWDNETLQMANIDAPVHGSLRLTLGHFAIEPFGGYYFHLLNYGGYVMSGPEAGGKLILGPAYFSYSMLFSNPSLHRFEAGVQFNDLLKF